MLDDLELLRRYAEFHDESAFAELVGRHLGMVFSAAQRRTRGDSDLAEEVSQAVFTALARQASSLRRHPALIGWLYKTTRFQANRALRTELRRRVRDREAQLMQQLTTEQIEADWSRIQPLLDGALDKLSDRDREAVLLRFIEKRKFSEIAAQLDLSEEGARTRVNRALERMREVFARDGIASTSAAISLALAGPAMASVPTGLVSTISNAALASASVVPGLGSLTIQFLIMNKINAVMVGALVVGATIAGIELNSTRLLATELRDLSLGKRQAEMLSADNRKQLRELIAFGENNRELAELAQVQLRIEQLQGRPPGVSDEKMKPSTEWQNAGFDSPEAAVETQLWAAKTGDLDVAATAYFHPPSVIAQADEFLSSLPDEVRTRYGTPQRLLAALIVPWGKTGNTEPVAFQIIGQVIENPDFIYLKTWTRDRDGFEGEMIFRLDRVNGKWGRGSLSDNDPDMKFDWTRMFNRVDRTTGDVRPLDLQTSSR